MTIFSQTCPSGLRNSDELAPAGDEFLVSRYVARQAQQFERLRDPLPFPAVALMQSSVVQEKLAAPVGAFRIGIEGGLQLRNADLGLLFELANEVYAVAAPDFVDHGDCIGIVGEAGVSFGDLDKEREIAARKTSRGLRPRR